ncbi:MAG: helix-turn-helix domain-containing protein [Gammaproteobacteria bacterium]|nr:helix-turn-helix domain-containing protein [Gammaproteobacteria bacterium]
MQTLYVIRSGTLKTSMFDENGEERILGFHLPGEMVGLDALGGDSHPCFAEVAERASLCAIPLNRLKDVLCVPRVHYQVLRTMGAEIHRREKQQVYMTYGAEKRLATFLLCLSVRLRKLGYEVHGFRLSMSRQDIANYLGLSLATVSRLLHQLQTEDRIQIQNRFVDILDMVWLKHTAAECLLGDC